MLFFLEETPDVMFAFWVGICVFALALIIFLTIIGMRWSAKRWEKKHLYELKRWRDLLEKILQGESVDLPPLSAGNTSEFLEAWNDAHDIALSGKELLREVGKRIGLSAAARRMLKGRYHDRAIAILALGHQGDPSDFEQLVPFLADSSPIISLCAARGLTQIDSAKAVELFVPAIAKNEFWPDGAVARILKDSGASAVTALSSAILRASDNTTAKLVRFLADTDARRAAPTIRQLMDSKVDDHVISTCLQVVSDPADVNRVRSFLTHPRWHVRMHAASALGRLGDATDEARLSPLLSDSQWWVRYRAAHALSVLSGWHADGVGHIDMQRHDKFAQDIIRHVMAEHLRKGST